MNDERFDSSDPDILAHYGRLGMKWGKHIYRQEAKKSGTKDWKKQGTVKAYGDAAKEKNRLTSNANEYAKISDSGVKRSTRRQAETALKRTGKKLDRHSSAMVKEFSEEIAEDRAKGGKEVRLEPNASRGGAKSKNTRKKVIDAIGTALKATSVIMSTKIGFENERLSRQPQTDDVKKLIDDNNAKAKSYKKTGTDASKVTSGLNAAIDNTKALFSRPVDGFVGSTAGKAANVLEIVSGIGVTALSARQLAREFKSLNILGKK